MADPNLRVDPADRLAGPPSGGKRRSGSGDGGKGRGRQRPPLSRRLWAFGLLLALWGLILGGGVLAYFAFTLPDTSHLTMSMRRPSVTILAADGSVIATYGDLFGQPVTLRQMSRYLPEAVIATEDRRFYSHFGVDPVGILRAAWADLRAGHIVEGGSTITQQLAKILFLTPQRRLSRKIQETLLALWLERRFTKNQILEIYLNRVYLGAGTYGVDAAARRYFRKPASELNLYESAVIAGLLKAPTRFSPALDPKAAAARAQQVLDNMVAAGFITRGQEAAALRGGSVLAKVAVDRPGIRYFTDWVSEQVRDFASTPDRDLVVHTTLEPWMQAAAEAAVTRILARDGRRENVHQGALVAMTPEGAVRAMVGGRDYNKSQFNRATEAERQPGSAFKPFVYLAGLEAGLSPKDTLVDRPIRIGDWRPHDFERRYEGRMTVAEALARSINTIAVQVALRAGVKNVIAVANRLGIDSTLKADPSVALGTDDVNLLELVSAYAPFANGGDAVVPYAITLIADSDGKIIYRRTGSGPGRVIAPEFVGEMNGMLAGVIDGGTGRAARLPRPAAGKTGTSQDYRDAWFIGYTANLVAGVWFGNDDDAPMIRVTGGSLPAAAWHGFMLAATRGMPVRKLPSGAPPAPGALASAPASIPTASAAHAGPPTLALGGTGPAPGGGLLDNLAGVLETPGTAPDPGRKGGK